MINHPRQTGVSASIHIPEKFFNNNFIIILFEPINSHLIIEISRDEADIECRISNLSNRKRRHLRFNCKINQ